jgi:hypothetical protein
MASLPHPLGFSRLVTGASRNLASCGLCESLAGVDTGLLIITTPTSGVESYGPNGILRKPRRIYTPLGGGHYIP